MDRVTGGAESMDRACAHCDHVPDELGESSGIGTGYDEGYEGEETSR